MEAIKNLVYDQSGGTWSGDLPEGVKNALNQNTPTARNIKGVLGI